MVQRTDQNSGRKSYAYKGFVNYATKVFFFFSWACSFSKYLLSTYYMPGTITTGNRASNRKRHHSCFPGASCSYLVTQSCLTLCDPGGCSPTGFLCTWDFFRQYWKIQNTGVVYHFLLQGIFLRQGSNPDFLRLLHYKQIFYLLSHWGSPFYTSSVYMLIPSF